MGRKKQPHYRIVVADGDSPRDGRFVEALGYYRPLSEPARLVLDLERVDYWIGVGALPSDTVGNLINKARGGGDDQLAVGEEDHEVRRAKRAEELAARRAAEKKALAEAAAGASRPAEKAEEAQEVAEGEAEAAQEPEAAAEEELETAEEAGAAAEEPDEPTAEADDSEGGEAPEDAAEEEEKDS